MVSIFCFKRVMFTKFQAVLKQSLLTKYRIFLQDFKGPVYRINFCAKEYGLRCLTAKKYENQRCVNKSRNLSLLGLLTAGALVIALNNNNVEAGNDNETPKKAAIQVRKKGKFAKASTPGKENEKLQKMNIGLAKRKLVFEDSDNCGEENKTCMKKTRSMEVNYCTLVAKRHMNIFSLFFYYIYTKYIIFN